MKTQTERNMLRVVFFDLGLTLIDSANQPFPHVKEALTAISGFVAEDGTPLRSCLVSDFTMAAPPVTAAKVTALFNQYLAILDGTGLRPFFEPVKKRVTLSTHAGARKPDRRIFEKAMQRLGASTIPFKDCLLITEESGHIQKARTELHMQTLQFRVAFHDWAEAPALIAHLVAPHQFANTTAVIKARLAEQGVELVSAEPGEDADSVRVHGQVWRPVSIPGFKDLQDVQVAIPVEGNMPRKRKKDTQKPAGIAPPSAETVAEVASFVKSLATHGQIAGPDGKPTGGATHQIETDEKGNRRLVRKRFSAI
jgi:hypothetical protein